MAEPQHFAVPFRFGLANVVTTIDGTPEEVADCVELIIRTVRGERMTLPSFGRPDSIEFSSNPELARAQLQAAIDESEPRARAIVEGDYDPLDPGVLRLRAMFALEAEIT